MTLFFLFLPTDTTIEAIIMSCICCRTYEAYCNRTGRDESQQTGNEASSKNSLHDMSRHFRKLFGRSSLLLDFFQSYRIFLGSFQYVGSGTSRSAQIYEEIGFIDNIDIQVSTQETSATDFGEPLSTYTFTKFSAEKLLKGYVNFL